MSQIEIYTADYCPYCVKAKALLERKNVPFEEVDVTKDNDARMALVKKSGGQKTVPQIFINGDHIGGCDDLYALESEGKLDTMLNG